MKIQSILPLLVISIHWMCLSHNNYMVSGLCLEDQMSLMLQLKNNLTFEPEYSTKLKTWNQSINCCQWGGVTCDDEGHVTGLDLSGELIYGRFDNSSSLFNLQHLQFLNLADNYFNSTIPSRINKLENLAYLNLSCAGFEGQIPKEISHLTRLVTLDLSCLDLDSDGLPMEQQLKLENPNISKLVQNLTSIRKLYLDGVLISTQVQEWSNSLLLLPGLQELSMSCCNLSGPLVSSLARLLNLSVLILDFNDLSSPVPNTYADFKKLTTLSLSYCGLIGTFPQKIFHVQTLSVIDISDNYNLHGSFPEFSPNGSLHTIEVSDTSFSGALPPSIGNMMQLSTLDLSFCQFNGTLPNSLSKLAELRYLDLSYNEFIGTIPSFKRLQNLISIDLSNNSIGGIIPSYLFTLPSLQEIWFSNNHFSQLEEFTNFSSSELRLLDLRFNDLSGPIPASIFQLCALVEIHLDYNSMNGSIPSSLFTLPSLEEIRLSNNQFNQLDEFTSMSSSVLWVLDLSYNSMNGSIPSSLFTLPSLVEIRLSNNQFTQLDEFPNVSSSALRLLDLRFNDLSGPIPASIFQLCALVEIHLDYNSMNGSIPSSLFTLPSLEEIWLSNNQFNQLDEFTNVSSSVLRFLDLSSNDLSGPIPASIFQLGGLEKLKLSSNKFNGTIHLNQFSTIRNLTSLDLSNNNLSFNENVTDADIASFPILSDLNMASCNLKTFPAFLRYQIRLSRLNLSDNQIQGTVPNWIWKLSNLQVLNFSHNFLTTLEGPFPIITPPFLRVLALHRNRLQGPIPFFPKDASNVVHSSDKFSSDIPTDGGSYMNKTYYLSLANNNFSGSIPDSICTASYLRFLDLSHNDFSGVLPSCLMTTSQTLGVLKLGSNNLIGPIPNTFPTSCAVHTVDLSRNRLDGSLPKSLANCTELEVLDIGRNLIVDGFPCFLNNISKLRVLVMRNNKFHGPIGCPTDNGDWPMLQIVDIAFNQFSGKLLGEWFKSWKAMMSNEDEAESEAKHIEFQVSSGQANYQDSVTIISKGQEMELVRILTIFTSIDFSYNEFEGPIPKELMDFKALYGLNLSNNALSGHVPSSIGNLKDLESLDLSNNSLDGEIPTEFASLNFLSVLNLSFNHLTGKIPTGTQLQSFQPSSFEGNDGLYGPPLTQIPNYGKQGPSPPASLRPGAIDWNFLSAELGLVFGLGIVIGPLLFWKRWRLWYWELSDRVLCRIFPQLSLEYETRKEKRYKVLMWRH